MRYSCRNKNPPYGLFRRDINDLTEWAVKAGADPYSVSIKSEETVVNLFLTIDNKGV
jgi:hypothetical protein